MWGGLVPDALIALSPADRQPPRRRGQRRGRRPAQRAGRRRRLPRGPAPRRVRCRRPASSGSAPARPSSGSGPSRRSRSSASTRPRSTAPPTPWSRPPAPGSRCGSRPATPRPTRAERLRAHLRAAHPVGRRADLQHPRHRRGHPDRRHRSGVRRRARGLRRGLGRHRADRHGRGRLDPVHRGVPRGRSPRPACWSPASRTRTPAPTAPTRASTSPSSSGSCTPRPCCSQARRLRRSPAGVP